MATLCVLQFVVVVGTEILITQDEFSGVVKGEDISACPPS